MQVATGRNPFAFYGRLMNLCRRVWGTTSLTLR